ncbi:MAG: hypothetical protein KQI62_17610 [Deltaproteobacteria bacterium]|nr:hypothetical protein [Deltaproteobacteria bacterium]
MLQIGLILDIIGAFLVGIDVIGPANLIKLNKLLLSGGDDISHRTFLSMEEAVFGDLQILIEGLRKVKQFRLLSYCLMFPIFLTAIIFKFCFNMLISYLIFRLTESLKKQDKTGIKIVPFAGILFLFVGFILQFFGSIHQN